jgi:hypothetical protein
VLRANQTPNPNGPLRIEMKGMELANVGIRFYKVGTCSVSYIPKWFTNYVPQK